MCTIEDINTESPRVQHQNTHKDTEEESYLSQSYAYTNTNTDWGFKSSHVMRQSYLSATVRLKKRKLSLRCYTNEHTHWYGSWCERWTQKLCNSPVISASQERSALKFCESHCNSKYWISCACHTQSERSYLHHISENEDADCVLLTKLQINPCLSSLHKHSTDWALGEQGVIYRKDLFKIPALDRTKENLLDNFWDAKFSFIPHNFNFKKT